MGYGPFLVTSQTAATADGNGAGVDLSQLTELAVFLNVSVSTGTNQELRVWLQDSADNVNFADIAEFPLAIATGTTRMSWTDLGRALGKWVRARWEIKGTSPSFDFTLKAAGSSI